ncbi:DUF3463 domain-containing protein, partial [Streptomyces sp. NPDC001193]
FVYMRALSMLSAARATTSSISYVPTYRELIEETDWSKYGRGKDPRCANCMAHCGYEPTAVLATMGSLKESLRAARETVTGNREKQ